MLVSRSRMAKMITISDMFLISILCIIIITSIKFYIRLDEFLYLLNTKINNIVEDIYSDVYADSKYNSNSSTILKLVFANNTNNKKYI